jgi:uncharacterized protein
MIRTCVCLALVSACAACTSPRERLYVLEGSSPDRVEGDCRGTVVLGPVTIPEEVDRPQIVVREGTDQLVMSEQERWALPLKQAIPRTLAAQLDRRGSYRFVTTSSAAIGSASAHLSVDITRFEVSRTDGAVVDAHWVYRSAPDDADFAEGDVAARTPVTAAGYDGIVDALRRATDDLAQQIARQLPSSR